VSHVGLLRLLVADKIPCFLKIIEEISPRLSFSKRGIVTALSEIVGINNLRLK
jgi:hypothetical protein